MTADWRAAAGITAAFKKLAPDDPVRYDFALTRLGIRADADLGGQMRFDADTRRHYHVRCVGCDRVDDVSGGPPAKLEKAFKNKSGYKILGHRIELIGLCPNCQNGR